MRVVLADPPAYTPPYDRSPRRRARPRGRGGRARDLALPLRRRAAAGGLRGARVVLPALVADGDVARAARGEGARAPLRDGAARRAQAGRAARAVARRARGRPLALPPALAGRLHGARHHPAPHRRQDEPLAHALRTLRPRRRALRARSRVARPLRRARGAAARDPAPGVPLRGRPRGRRSHSAPLRAHPAVQGRRGRGRGRPPRRRRAARWSRATRASRSTASSGRRASVRSGGSASFRTRRSGAR